ncbi:uncharacterized protein LOC124350735 [Daphnia pulicaria]|uniref:uncharacterized protein LOC124350735 n=1 Tax=Daphnia pulicaria TaxID=35523 RepID=UPI001EEC3974|nr:uncharacterized protein LOC124350735 [Daphnia pulicaria]
MQVFCVLVILTSFTVISLAIADEGSNDTQSQKSVSFIIGAFNRELNVAGRTSRQLDVTTTITLSTTVSVACAKIVNVTGSCRRRRGHWEEDPIVLTFDDETEKLTESLFTPLYSIETTELPQMTVNGRPSRSVLSDRDTTVDDGRLASSMRSVHNPYVPSQPRIYFQQLFNFIGKIFSAILPNQRPPSTTSTQSIPSTSSTPTTAPTTSTDIFTPFDPIGQIDLIVPEIFISTVEYWTTITSTNTFFIQQCTPSPFLFLECSPSRRYS